MIGWNNWKEKKKETFTEISGWVELVIFFFLIEENFVTIAIVKNSIDKV